MLEHHAHVYYQLCSSYSNGMTIW